MWPVCFALLSGVLFALSLPPYNLEFLGWGAIAPFLVVVQGRKTLESVGLAMIAGIVCGGIHAGWWNHDTNRLLWAYLPFLWVTVLFVFVALASLATRRTLQNLPWVISVACIAVSLEWLTTFLPLPINVALSQYRQTLLIQIASITGIWGVSFLLWLANAAIADAVLQRRRMTPGLALSVAMVLVTVCYGASLSPRTESANEPRVIVAAIQDFTGDETGDLAPIVASSMNVDREEMTRQAAQRGAQLVVWSEECLGSSFMPDSKRDSTVALARQSKMHLVVGYSDQTLPKPYNCAAIVTPAGLVAGVHHKNCLYLGERQTVKAGTDATSYGTALGKLGMEVCFDSGYTGVTRRVAASGAKLIAMPNYDPPSPHGVLHYLHSAMLPYRAVENHVPFVRADSNGLSQVVSKNGTVLGQSKLFAPDILIEQVSLGDGAGTFFTRWGDWLAYLCVLVSFAVMGRVWFRDGQALLARRRSESGTAAQVSIRR